MAHKKLIAQLEPQIQPVAAHDPMPEAGRKILLANFVTMLEREDGSRSGEDIEDVHKMRVALRRMRSAFRVFEAYYETKPVRPFIVLLRKTARALGPVRDLDVMIDDLTKYQATCSAEDAAAIGGIIDKLAKKRVKARAALLDWLDSKSYRGGIKAFATFVTQEGSASLPPETPVAPHQVRHVAPAELYRQVGIVRAYDTVINGEGDTVPETLHALRIEFKRLRYLLDFFQETLGTTAADFITETKKMQDHLGRLNDVVVAQAMLGNLKKLDADQTRTRDAYIAMLQAEAEQTIIDFPNVWAEFNRRPVQRKLADALLVLR